MAIVKETSGNKKLLLSKPFDKEDDFENILAINRSASRH
jgi:hypothetical protein